MKNDPERAKRLAGAVLAAGAITAMPFQAFAQRSPEFAYSAEKWATLRDNKLEFDEISDLVHRVQSDCGPERDQLQGLLCTRTMMLAQDYDGKVQVVDNQRISVTMKLSVLDAMKMAEDGLSAAEIKRILEEQKFNSSIYIMVDTLKYLKKGGRITPAAAALGTLLRLKPFCRSRARSWMLLQRPEP